MDIDRLYGAFLAIARSGALTRAARQLGCSAAAISRQLDALESHLGARLFDRTMRSVRLSEAVLSDWQLPAAQIWLAWRNRGSNRESVAHVAHHLREQLTALAQGSLGNR